MLQLVTQNDLSTSEARYLEVVQGKTAALFAAACQIGAVVADRPEREEAALAEYGMKLGIAFQLVDDALDYVADQATLGKTIGDDFREGKITLPVLVAFLAGDDLERAFWQRTIEALEQTDSDLDHAMRLIAHHGAIRVTLDRAQRFVQEAKAALAIFPDSPIRRALADVADYTVQRLRGKGIAVLTPGDDLPGLGRRSSASSLAETCAARSCGRDGSCPSGARTGRTASAIHSGMLDCTPMT